MKSLALNGHAPTNGTSTATSPPKSPVPAPVDHRMPSEMAQNNSSSAPGSAPPAETQPTEQNVSPPQGQDSATPVAADAAAGDVAPSVQAPVHDPTPSESTGGLIATSDPMAIDTPQVATPDPMAIDTPQDVSAAPKTELPHHPNPDSAPISLPAPQTVDQQMEDASQPPPSPSKMSRQRDSSIGIEEPSAKRTKVEGEDSAVNVQSQGFTTSATGTPGPIRTGGPGLTKLQHKFISKSLTSLKRMHDARFYKEPVDAVKLNIPQYHTIITQPMDLGTMEKKLKNNEYSSPEAVADDFALMVNNTTVFNGADHLVTQEGIKLKAVFDKQMKHLPKADEVEEKKPKKQTEKTSAARREPRTSLPSQPKAASPQSQTFALGPEGLPVIRRDSFNPDGRPKRSIHPPKRDLPYSTKPKKKKFQWELRFCQEVLDEMHKQKHYSWVMPFYYPVDPVALNIPTYHSVIKKPMDLSTVQSKLKTGQYENAKEFETDVRQIFKNCFRFNIPGDPTYICGQRAEEIFNAKWTQKSDYLEAHEPHPEQNTDSSDEDSDEDAEESEEDDEKLTLLQKQIAEMSRQVEAITNKKKKTPPSSKKVGKTKLAKKESKKISSGKKDKKSKSSQPGKVRAITYNEKQIISNGISSLPDKKMQQALQIIQNNVPQLKVSSLFCSVIYEPWSNLYFSGNR
jgi:bromodomain-containing factor 1